MAFILEGALSNAVVAAVLAAIVIVVSRYIRRPELIHGLWVVVLLKLVTPPVVALPLFEWPVASEPGASRVESAPTLPVASLNVGRTTTELSPTFGGQTPADGSRVNTDRGFRPPSPEGESLATPPEFPSDQKANPQDNAIRRVVPGAPIVAGSPAKSVIPSRPEGQRSRNSIDADSRETALVVPTAINWMAAIIGVWIAGAVVVLALAAFRVWKFHRLLNCDQSAPEWLRLEVDELAKQIGLKRAPAVSLVPGALSPLLWAVGRQPRLIFPEDLLEHLDRQQRRSVLLHELAHMRRRDHWVRFLELAAGCLYWWNPVVLWARREIHRNEEFCCDGWVVRHQSDAETSYARALLVTVDFLASARPVLPPAASGIGGAEFLKHRLTKIMNDTTPRRLAGVSRLAVIALAVCVLPLLPTFGDAIPRPADEIADNSSAEPQAKRSAVSAAKPKPSHTAIPLAIISSSDPENFASRSLTLPDLPKRTWRLSISPDGKRLAVASSGSPRPGQVRVFDIRTKKQIAEFHEPMGIPSVAYSRDGRWLAYGRWDPVVKIVDAKTLKVVKELDIGKRGGSRVAFSPDGKLLATAAEGEKDAQGVLRGEVKLWEVPTGKLIARLEGEMLRFHDVCFSPDGTLLAVAGGHMRKTPMGQVKVWNVKTRKQMMTLKGHTASVFSVSFSPDGQTIATGSVDNSVRLWRRRDGALKKTLLAHTGNVQQVVFSRKGQMLATTAADGTARLWSANEGTLEATLRGHTGVVRTAAFTPDGETLATASEDGIVRLWSVARKTETGLLQPASSADDIPDPVLAVAWSPDGDIIATAHEDKSVRLRSAETGVITKVLTGHTDAVSQAVFSPDGRVLATASFDKTVKLWDVTTGKERRTLRGHTNWVLSVAFSPDGGTIASGGYDRLIRLWDAKTGKETAQLKGHTASVRSVSFSKLSKLLASGGSDRVVKLWDTETKKELTTLKGHQGSIRAVAFSPDGKTLASASEDKSIKLWDVKSRKERTTLNGHRGMVWCLAFTGGGKTLATGGFDNVIKIWDVASGRLRQTLSGHTDVVTSLAMRPDSGVLISGSYDKSLRRWNAVHPTIPPTATLKPNKSQIRFVLFSPDGRKMVTGSMDHEVTVRDMKTGTPLHVLAGHTKGVLCGALSSDGDTLATGGFDQSVRLWSLKTGKPIATIAAHQGTVMSLAFSPDGKKLASGCSDKKVRLLDVKSRSVIRVLPARSLWVTGVAFSPDGKTLASSTGSWDDWRTAGEVNLWDVETGAPQGALTGHTNAIGSVKFSPDGRFIVAPGWDRTVRVWDAKTRKPLSILRTASGAVQVSFLPDDQTLAVAELSGRITLWNLERFNRLVTYVGHDKNAHEVACSHDGTLLASAGIDGFVKFWSTTAGPARKVIEPQATVAAHEKPVMDVTVSRDGRMFASVSADGSAAIWDLKTRKKLQQLAGHTAAVQSAAFSPDGKILATGSWDKTIRLWIVATGKPLATLPTQRGGITSLAFTINGNTLVSSASDGAVKIWDVASRRLRKSLPAQNEAVNGIAVSPDGKLLATADGALGDKDQPGRVKLWDLDTGKELATFTADDTRFTKLQFNKTGQFLAAATTAAAGKPQMVKVWNVKTRVEEMTTRHTSGVYSIAFLPSGGAIATAERNGSVEVWSIATRRRVARYQGHAKAVYSIACSEKENVLLSAGQEGEIKIWPIPTSMPASNTAHATTADAVRNWGLN